MPSKDKPSYSHMDEPTLKMSGDAEDYLLENSPDDHQLGVGCVVGPFRIEGTLGHGGMGTVYKAVRKDDFNQTVALKVLTNLDHSGKLLMEKEIKILANLQHNNISHLIDADLKCQDRPWMAMEYIDGLMLDVYLEQKTPSIKERLKLFLKICDGLAYAHNQLIIHRDIKPSNILITPNGEPKLLDFGIAAVLDPATGQQNKVTARLERFMTPEYASPEQADGRRLSVQSDVYSMGVLLYEVLTGVLPYRFDSRHPTDVLRTIFEAPIRKPSTRRDLSSGKKKLETRQLKGDLDTIVLKALQRDVVNRYKDISTFAGDIQAYLKGLPIQAQPATFSYIVGKFVKRNTWPLAFACSTLFSLIGFSVYAQLQNQRLAVERDRALQEQQTSQKVTQLLVSMFHQVDPKISQTKDVKAIDVLDEGSRQLQRQLDDTPQIKLALTHALGQVYRAIGDFETAERNIREAIALNPSDVPVDLQLELVGILLDKGELKDVEKLAQELEQKKDHFSPPQLAQFYIIKGNQAYNIGAFHVAENWFQKAYDHREHLLHHEQTQLEAKRMELYSELHEFHTVSLLAQEHLVRVQEAYGENSYHYAEACIYMAIHYLVMGQPEEAVNIMAKSVDVAIEILGEQHPLYLKILHSKAQVLANVRRNQEAFELDRKAYDLAQLHLSKSHPLTMDISRKLALKLIHRGEEDQAETLVRESLAQMNTMNRLPSAERVGLLNTLAYIIRLRGSCEEAIQINRQVLREVEINFSANHPLALDAIGELSACYHRRGQFELAKQYRLRVVEITEHTFGPFSDAALIQKLEHINFLSAIDETPESIRLLNELIKTVKENNLNNFLDNAFRLNSIGMIFEGGGFYKEAMKYYNEAIRLDALASEDEGYERDFYPAINLAMVYSREGHTVLARKSLQETLKEAFPSRELTKLVDPFLVNNMGYMHRINGDHHLAAPFFEAVLDVVEEKPDFTFTIYPLTLANMARIALFKNDHDLVKLLLHELDQVRVHDQMNQAITFIYQKEIEWQLYLETNDWDMANQLECHFEELIESSQDSHHPLFSSSQLLKVRSRILQGNTVAASTLLEKLEPVIEQQENLIFKAEFKVLKAQTLATSSPSEALRLLSEAIMEQKALVGENHPMLADTYMIYADLLSMQDQELDYALELAKQADHIYHALLDQNHPKRNLLQNLIYTLKFQRDGNPEDARKAISALRSLEETFNRENYNVKLANKRLQRMN